MMVPQLLVGLLCLGLVRASALPADGGRASSVTTLTLVRGQGYEIQEHTVQTSDGYILTMHRIPYSKNTGYDGVRPVVFLMHGLLCSSSDWVLGGTHSGLAYLLSEAGYDVWMGNARGNTYSKKHATKTPLLQPFWNFEWHDIGIYDLPAMMDYVLYTTGADQLSYVGHSQGTTSFFVLNSMIPRFKSRIRSAHLLAPVAWMEHMESPLAVVGGPLLGQPNAFVELFGSAEFLPNTQLMNLLGGLLCSDQSISQVICTNSLFLLGGWNSPYLNETLIPEIMATTPAGCSVNQIFHYLQEYNSGYFRQFDYGSSRNKKEYGSKTAPDYDVAGINVPTYLYYSDNDYFASLIDVDRLRYVMDPNSLRSAYRLPETKWNHLDFLWGLNVKEILYDRVLNDIRNA
ncbi:lipase 3 [Drosophila guanche]|uniref:Lipase n=1 Tax=Drosophila guanche TaxID=7266 RepID=A0A3B0J0P8_DROGU|nr:lipase 3 [Drosophila guanche]SPP74295.1 blast:Lipase 3 [Drosophila guanche]